MSELKQVSSELDQDAEARGVQLISQSENLEKLNRQIQEELRELNATENQKTLALTEL